MLPDDYSYVNAYTEIPSRGWQCPICHHVFSPTVTECPYCGDRETVDTNKITIEKKGNSWTINDYEPYTVTLKADGT